MAQNLTEDILDSDQAEVFQEAFKAGFYKDRPSGVLDDESAVTFHEGFTAGLAKRRTLLRV
jgi:hypothetical protein